MCWFPMPSLCGAKLSQRGWPLTCTVSLPMAPYTIYMRWAQEEIKVPLGTLTEGSIEVANKDVKAANKKFVARISAKRIHRDILSRRSWECDLLLHFEMTQLRVWCYKSLSYQLVSKRRWLPEDRSESQKSANFSFMCFEIKREI